MSPGQSARASSWPRNLSLLLWSVVGCCCFCCCSGFFLKLRLLSRAWPRRFFCGVRALANVHGHNFCCCGLHMGHDGHREETHLFVRMISTEAHMLRSITGCFHDGYNQSLINPHREDTNNPHRKISISRTSYAVICAIHMAHDLSLRGRSTRQPCRRFSSRLSPYPYHRTDGTVLGPLRFLIYRKKAQKRRANSYNIIQEKIDALHTY